MTNQGVPTQSWSRRVYRGFVFAIIVGLVGAGLATIPGLFIQSIFVGEAQRCIEAQRIDMAVRGYIETECGQDFVDPPIWLPVAVIIGGAGIGSAGGLTYGLASPSSVPRRRTGSLERPWLPF